MESGRGALRACTCPAYVGETHPHDRCRFRTGSQRLAATNPKRRQRPRVPVVGGTASKPTLQLKSQPELAQADILSLLLFGKTTGALGQNQQAGLQQRATKMATGAVAHQIGQAVANSMGLQSMGIELNDVSSTGPAVGAGHYLGQNTYVSASQPVGGTTGQKVSIQYFLMRWLSITTSTASDGSHEIDLNLVKQY